jgi:hypothetical protein
MQFELAAREAVEHPRGTTQMSHAGRGLDGFAVLWLNRRPPTKSRRILRRPAAAHSNYHLHRHGKSAPTVLVARPVGDSTGVQATKAG